MRFDSQTRFVDNLTIINKYVDNKEHCKLNVPESQKSVVRPSVTRN